MSKTTKLIAAIGGGIVVLLFILSLIFPNSALGGWQDLVGCSKKAKKAPPRFCDRPENKNSRFCKNQAKAKAKAKQADEEEDEGTAKPAARPAGGEARPAGDQGKAAGQGGAAKEDDDD